MKRIIIFLILFTIFGAGCKKEDIADTIAKKQELHESNLAFINSAWTFEVTGNTLKDQIIGLWLSDEVSYQDTICINCDGLFTWVVESTGTMVKRNNDFGDDETFYGDWEIDHAANMIYFNYKLFSAAGTANNSGNFQLKTDSVKIKALSDSNLWVSQFIDYPPTTKIDIKFNKLK